MLVVDTASPTPPYEQLRAQIVDQVDQGLLAPGTQLPTVRRLAADLGLAPNTVARAYRELELAGVVLTGGRRGTVVAQPSSDVGEDARRSAGQFVTAMRGLGISPTDAVHLVRQAYQAT